jgi:predicted DNA-binding transcriptional regulator AlpA
MLPSKVPPKRHSLLPPTLAPRGLSGPEAAAYVGVSYTKFIDMVEDGRMPKPKQINDRRVWDRHKLDRAFDALPGDEENDGNPWDGFLNAA